MADILSNLAVGQVVKLSDGRSATVRYVGNPDFAAGDWVGLELDTATGKNDGEVQGERYFDCASNHGMFVRAAAIKSIVSAPSAGANGGPPEARRTSRPVSSTVSGLRRQSAMDPAKRQSISGASPSVDGRASLSRSPAKSPTKISGISTPSTSGTRTPITSNRPRPSVGGRTSMAPPARPAGAAPGRVSLAERAGSTRPSGVATSPTRRTTVGRQASVTSFAPRAPKPQLPGGGGLVSARGSRDDGKSAKARSPTERGTLDTPSSKTYGEGSKGGSIDTEPLGTPDSTTSQDPMPSTLTQRTINSLGLAAADHREVEELKKKMRMIEKKRMEDRDKLKTLERVQAERDKFEAIIQKLQAKFQPQHQEVISLRKQLSDASAQMDSLEPQQAEHEYLVEMATLDRLMAEEKAEVLKTEVEALKQRLEELQLESDVLQAENQELGQGPDAEERSSQSWLQMEREKDRLREALLRLRDMTQEREAELEEQLKSREDDLQDFAALKERHESTRERLLVAEANVEDLRQQLDTALGAEAMIEELTQRNVDLGDRVEELAAANQELEGLQQINDEIELDHVEYEKQMQQELDDKDGLLAKHARHLREQAEAIEENAYTIARYKEIVKTLQSELEHVRTSHQLLGAEADETTTRSRAMLDVNMKLQASARKSQANHIDMELRKLDAQEASELLKIVTPFLPEGYLKSQDSVSALLRVRRVGFKAHLLHEAVRERMNGKATSGHEEDAFAVYEILDRLTWVTAMSRRFVSNLGGASVERFGKFDGALYDLEPVERALTGWINGLRGDELKEKQCATELQRIIALMTHLAEVHLTDRLETHADATHMRVLLTQSHLNNTSQALTRIKDLVETHAVSTDEDSDFSHTFAPQIATMISHTRSANVIVGKTLRALSELHDRSLAVPPSSSPHFDSTETHAASLLTLTLHTGVEIARLTSEEGRTTPLTYTDIASTVLLALQASDPSPSAPLSPLTAQTAALHPLLTALLTLTTDLPSATEFFPPASTPWASLAASLGLEAAEKAKTEDESRRLRQDLLERATQLAVREQEKDEMGVKIELLQARMRDASQHAQRVAELETAVRDRETRERELLHAVERLGKEVQQVESERERYKRVASSSTVVAGASSAEKLEQREAVATGREVGVLRGEIESLKAAVRFLREEKRRGSPGVLPPLVPERSAEMDALALKRSEQAAVLRALVKKVESAAPVKHAKAGKGWRPRRETQAWRMVGVRDEWEQWRGWVGDALDPGDACAR